MVPDGRWLDHGIFPDQFIADFGCAPGRMFPFDAQDRPFDLEGQLVGVTVRSAAAIVEGVEATFLIALENLVAGDA